MHETDPAAPTLADLEARWDAANDAVKAHAELDRARPAPDFEVEDELWDWLAERQAWRVEWARLQAAAREAVVVLYRARQAAKG